MSIEAIKSQLSMISEMMRKHHPNCPRKYVSIDEFVLLNGIEFKEMSTVASPMSGLPRQCFENAWRLCQAKRGLQYVEGYAMGIIPVLHAWCIDRQNRVVDNTWVGGSGRADPGIAYFGVPISHRFVNRIRKTTGMNSVLDNWKAGFKVLSGETEAWRVKVPSPATHWSKGDHQCLAKPAHSRCTQNCSSMS